MLCLVDDAQWLDDASAQVIAFVARRLLGGFGGDRASRVREPSAEPELEGLPELSLGGLADEDARALLATVVPGRLDDRVRDRIIEETRGNPLALLELPRGMGVGGAGRWLRAPGRPGTSRSHRGALSAAHRRTARGNQRLMLVAAADPVGDAPLFGEPPRCSVSGGTRRRRRRASSSSRSGRG